MREFPVDILPLLPCLARAEQVSKIFTDLSLPFLKFARHIKLFPHPWQATNDASLTVVKRMLMLLEGIRDSCIAARGRQLRNADVEQKYAKNQDVRRNLFLQVRNAESEIMVCSTWLGGFSSCSCLTALLA